MNKSYSISMEQIDALLLPLGKAKGILWCVLDSMNDAHQSDAIYAAMDLIDQGGEIASGFTDCKTIPEQNGKAGDKDHPSDSNSGVATIEMYTMEFQTDPTELISKSISIARVLEAVDPGVVPDDVINRAAGAVADMLQAVEDETHREWEKKQAERDKELKAGKFTQSSVRTYFDPETPEEKRAQLEGSITDKDIDAELHQLESQEKMWPMFIKRDEKRLELANTLKAKRAQAA